MNGSLRSLLIALPLAVTVALLIWLASGGGSGDEGPEGSGGAGLPAAAAELDGDQAEATVERIVDGDTVIADVDGFGEERVRFIGIDTPESAIPDQAPECYGHEAAELNEHLVAGADVILVLGREQRDQYGRLLAYVFRAADGLLVNEELIAQGAAEAIEIEPNTELAGDFEQAESAARDDQLGLWGVCS